MNKPFKPTEDFIIIRQIRKQNLHLMRIVEKGIGIIAVQ